MSSNNDIINVLNILVRKEYHGKKFPKLSQTSCSGIVYSTYPVLGSDSGAYILEATRTWHVQHEFSYCRYDIVLLDTKITFWQGV